MATVIDYIDDVRPDGSFVVAYNGDQILTMNAPVPNDLAKFKTRSELFLAGVAYARLEGAQARSRVMVLESEEL